MTQSHHDAYEITERFFFALQAKALELERNAQTDALQAITLTDPDHVLRQNRLAQAQRDEAHRFRSFLADARIRIR